MVIQNTCPTDFELGRVIQTVGAADPGITGQLKKRHRTLGSLAAPCDVAARRPSRITVAAWRTGLNAARARARAVLSQIVGFETLASKNFEQKVLLVPKRIA